MRRTFSLGALALLLPGSALVPAIAESSFASTQNEVAVVAASSSAAPEPTPGVAIREAGPDVVPDQGIIKQAPPTRLAPAAKPAPRVLHSSNGQASWYGPGFYGNRTANGEVFRPMRTSKRRSERARICRWKYTGCSRANPGTSHLKRWKNACRSNRLSCSLWNENHKY